MKKKGLPTKAKVGIPGKSVSIDPATYFLAKRMEDRGMLNLGHALMLAATLPSKGAGKRGEGDRRNGRSPFGSTGGGGGGAYVPAVTVPPAFVLSARKIINAANNYVARTVMASPPTMTQSADFANSTIGGGVAGSPTIASNDARLRTTAQLINQFSSWYGGWNHDDIILDGGDGWGFGIKTNSSAIEISLTYGQPNYNFMLRVDGQWYAASDISLFGASPTFNPRFIKFDFGTTATRTIEWFMRHSQDTQGINLVSGATLSLPGTSASDVSAAIWGDSYVEAGDGGPIRGNTAQLFGDITGVNDIIPCGRSNQGYVLQRDSRTIAGRMVLDAPGIAAAKAVDVVYAYGSVNDYNQSVATIQANVTTGIAALKSAFPNAWIVFFSCFNTTNNHIDTAHNAAFMAGVQAVADFRTVIIDTQALGWPVTAATTGLLPNGQAHDSIDGVHPGPNEKAYLTGVLMKPAMIAALRARAGI